jgi:cobalamin biosynthesis Mg chelatase CobN
MEFYQNSSSENYLIQQLNDNIPPTINEAHMNNWLNNQNSKPFINLLSSSDPILSTTPYQKEPQSGIFLQQIDNEEAKKAAEEAKKKAEEAAKKYAAEEAKNKKVAEEAKKKAEEATKKATGAAKKKSDEAAKKAVEEAKKKIQEATKKKGISKFGSSSDSRSCTLLILLLIVLFYLIYLKK